MWLGTAGWSYLPDWVGPFYPEGTSSSDALAKYVEAFRFVEVDSTFYAAPVASTIDRWKRVMTGSDAEHGFADVPPGSGFRVSFKAPKELVQSTGLRPPEIPFAHFDPRESW